MTHSPTIIYKVYLVLLILTMGIGFPLSPTPATAFEFFKTKQPIPDIPPSKRQTILFKLMVAEMAATRKLNSVALENYLEVATKLKDFSGGR